jgi:hypothetical protein
MRDMAHGIEGGGEEESVTMHWITQASSSSKPFSEYFSQIFCGRLQREEQERGDGGVRGAGENLKEKDIIGFVFED